VLYDAIWATIRSAKYAQLQQQLSDVHRSCLNSYLQAIFAEIVIND